VYRAVAKSDKSARAAKSKQTLSIGRAASKEARLGRKAKAELGGLPNALQERSQLPPLRMGGKLVFHQKKKKTKNCSNVGRVGRPPGEPGREAPAMVWVEKSKQAKSGPHKKKKKKNRGRGKVAC